LHAALRISLPSVIVDTVDTVDTDLESHSGMSQRILVTMRTSKFHEFLGILFCVFERRI